MHEGNNKCSIWNGIIFSAQVKILLRSYASDFGKFSMQMENRAVRMRTAHLHWLIDNKVFTNNNIDDYQCDLRQHRPSNSARFPIRIPRKKKDTDPEWSK